MSNICSKIILTRTNVFDKLNIGSDKIMEKVLKKYGVVFLLYVTVIGGVLILSSRLRYLNNQTNNAQVIAINE